MLFYVQGLLARATKASPPWPLHPLQRAVALLRERYPDKEDILPALRELASAACSYGKADEARTLAEEMLRRTLAMKGDDNLFVDEANWLLGGLNLKAGQPTESVVHFERALAGFTRHVGEQNPDAVVTHFGLAQAYLASGRADDSRRILEEAREQMRRDHAGDKRLERLLDNAEQQLAKIANGERPRCGA